MKTEQEIKNMIKQLESLKLECVKGGNFQLFSSVIDMINILKWAIELDFENSFLALLKAAELININE